MQHMARAKTCNNENGKWMDLDSQSTLINPFTKKILAVYPYNIEADKLAVTRIKIMSNYHSLIDIYFK